MRGKQLAAERAAELRNAFVQLQARLLEEHFSRERVSVGVESCGGKAQGEVAGPDALAGNDLAPADPSDDRAGKVVFVFGIEARHLRRLPADERAARAPAGARNAANDFRDNLRAQPPGGEVVEEKQRRRAVHGDVVDRMADKVGGDARVAVHRKGDLEFGSYAIRARHEHRVARQAREREEAGECADILQDAGVERGPGQPLDLFLGPVRRVNRHTRVRVSRHGPGII